MSFAILFPVFLGFAAVLQGGLNRQIATAWGLPGAVLINNFVLLCVASVFYMLTRVWTGGMPDLIADRGAFRSFHLWYIIPGVLGFFLVAGIPWAIVKVGAMRFFVALVGAQILASVTWDIYVEKLPVGGLRVLGAALAMSGAVLVALDRTQSGS